MFNPLVIHDIVQSISALNQGTDLERFALSLLIRKSKQPEFRFNQEGAIPEARKILYDKELLDCFGEIKTPLIHSVVLQSFPDS